MNDNLLMAIGSFHELHHITGCCQHSSALSTMVSGALELMNVGNNEDVICHCVLVKYSIQFEGISKCGKVYQMQFRCSLLTIRRR